ncbi:MAG: hypothetical protein ACFFD4_07465 [Candidatus Odinarchaeota archaeon]
MAVEIKNHVLLAKQFIKRDGMLIIGVLIGLTLTIAFVGVVYPGEGEAEGLDEMVQSPLYQAMLGPMLASLGSLEGWLGMGWLSWSWWVGLPLAFYLGLRIFTLEIAQGTADNLFVAPVSRKEIILTRYLTSCLIIFTVPVSGFIGAIITYLYLGEQLPLGEMLGVVAVDYLFYVAALSLTVLVSVMLVEMGRTIVVVGAFYLASYFSHTIGSMNEDLQLLQDFSIFQARPIMEIFINSATDNVLPNSLLLVALAAILLAASLIIAEKVEIRRG